MLATPDFRDIPKVLREVKASGLEVWLVHPMWPGCVWWKSLLALKKKMFNPWKGLNMYQTLGEVSGIPEMLRFPCAIWLAPKP